MNMYDILYKKREGAILNSDEIKYFVHGYTKGIIPDYQASAFLMAIFFQKMNQEETYLLTDAMRHSGDVLELSDIKGIKVDKHSTGGVGDKTTLIVGPLAAACGVPIAKMSGRSLGFTGGTIDKLESIPGFRTTLDEKMFIDLVNRVGLSIIGQSQEIAPADKKIYALRDVTATVDNISLIASSIMSKKLALGSNAIILDVKCGNGAFMQNFEEACDLAQLMVDIGKADGKKTIAIITDMSQPLGMAVGNSLEVIEAIQTLKNQGPPDITELALILAGYMVYAGEKASSPEKGYQMVCEVIENGKALEKLIQFISGQSGNPKVTEDYNLFPQPIYKQEIYAEESGYVIEISAKRIGMTSQYAGAGREQKEDPIDLSAGILLNKKIGNKVENNSLLATVYGNDKEKVKKGAEEAAKAFIIGNKKPNSIQLIKKIIQ
ncbi:MAG: pyrimidine-nucleoside phosphorylase [Anaerovoracaceae bacterium]|jgi:pyrimidine-nucleoside phosphorylase